MKFSIGYNFDSHLIKYFKEHNKKDDFIFQVFFALKNGYLGSARYKEIPKLSLVETEKQFKRLKTTMDVNYLLNSSFCPDLGDSENLRKLDEYISWVVSQKPSIVTVANINILKFLRDKYPNLPVNVSIVFGLKTIKQVNALREKFPNIKRITLHQTVNRDRALLLQHIKNAKKKKKGMAPVEIELLANELCLYNCPKMKKHYFYNSKMSFENVKDHKNSFEAYCIEKRPTDTIYFLNSCFIRPEDVSVYEKLGVDIIKLSGRDASSNYLKRISKAYLSRHYSGNVMDLFDPVWWPEKKPPFIDNRDLDGFLKYLWDNKLKKLTTIPKKFELKWKYRKLN